MPATSREARSRGPWHIVNRVTGKHLGPFSSEVDCALARSIATPDWATGIDMDSDTFDRHLDDQLTGARSES